MPKLLVHQGRLYLYWTAVRAASSGPWLDVTTRGAELALSSDRRLGVLGRTSAIKPNDPISVEVWGLVAQDVRQNSVADVFQVYSDGVNVYATAAVGGWDKASFPGWETRAPSDPRQQSMCLGPLSPVTGCYRLGIARAVAPLEYRGFNVESPDRRVPDSLLPANPHEYARLVHTADGTSFLMGMYLPQASTPDAGKTDVGSGLWRFDLAIGSAAPLPGCASALRPGEELLLGQFLCSPAGRSKLIMQGDGNLVLYDAGPASWATGTNGKEGHVRFDRFDSPNERGEARLRTRPSSVQPGDRSAGGLHARTWTPEDAWTCVI